ncbi:MAG: hypothetical protein PVF34_12080, partial [Gammaproteobacteria bacterium]
SQKKAAPPVLKPAPGSTRQVKPQTAQQQPRSAAQSRPISASPQMRQRAATPPSAQPITDFQVQSGGRSVLGYIKSHHKEVVALLGTLGIFISMFYNKFDTKDPDTDNARVVVASQKQHDKPIGIRTQDLKLIAQLMMEGNSWSQDLIDDFITQWNRLSKREKQTVKTTDWYIDFSSMLARQIKTTRTKASTGDVAAIYDQQALLSLADTLIFGNDPKAKTLLAEEVKAAKIALDESDDNSELASAAKAKDRSTAPVKQPERKDAETTVTAKTTERDIAKRPIATRHRISRTEIEDVINQFTVAFEAGQTRELMSLFADADYSSSFASLNSVKKDYQTLIRNSNERRLNLDSFFWEHDYGEIRGTAKYRARVKMANPNIDKTITGDLNITIRRLLGKNYITNFTLDNKKVVSKTRNPDFLPPAKKTTAEKGKPDFPTPAELQDLVTQYVSAYETGDVTELMHLFANATWTKSRTGLVEMKQNYDNLFATTSGREMFIKNITWKVKGKKALGTGDLMLTLHTDDEQVKTQQGKIRIVATKVGDSVRFSQMFHIVE